MLGFEGNISSWQPSRGRVIHETSSSKHRTLSFGKLVEPERLSSPAPSLESLASQKTFSQKMFTKLKQFPRKLLKVTWKPILVTTVGWLGIWGGGQLYDGDGKLPAFNNIATQYAKEIHQNTTTKFIQDKIASEQPISDEEIWQHMQPTLKLLKALSPEIAQWVEDLHQAGKIRYTKEHPEGNSCGFDHISGELHLHKVFFTLDKDGEKAAELAHEYRHARQNKWKVVSHFISPQHLYNYWGEKAAKKIGKKVSTEQWIYGSRIEDEAHLYEKQACQAMGISSSGVDLYLTGRGLFQYQQTNSVLPPNKNQP